MILWNFSDQEGLQYILRGIFPEIFSNFYIIQLQFLLFIVEFVLVLKVVLDIMMVCPGSDLKKSFLERSHRSQERHCAMVDAF